MNMKVEVCRRGEEFGADYRSVYLDGRPIGRLRRCEGGWAGFTTFTDRTPHLRELHWTAAASGVMIDDAARAVAAEYVRETSSCPSTTSPLDQSDEGAERSLGPAARQSADEIRYTQNDRRVV